MSAWWIEILVIFLLILVNGLLSMSEIAIVSARQNRLQQRALQGDEKAGMALKLAQDPTSFLSTVQVGITLVGVLTSVFGGARISDNLAGWISKSPFLAPYSEALAVSFVVLLITYFTLVLGELAPKRLALNSPEAIARAMASPLRAISRLTYPAVRFLGFSTNLVLRLIGARPSDEPLVTDDDVRALLEQGAQAGIFEEAEEDMVAGIFRLSDLRVGKLMTPRSEIAWIDIEDSLQFNQEKIANAIYARFPVARGSLDDWIGIVQSKDLLRQLLSGQPLDLMGQMIQPLVVPESMLALKVLEQFKESGVHIALVLDEFGTLQGLVTIFDILEAIVGDIPSQGEPVDQLAVQREDGTWLMDGRLSIDDFKAMFELPELPDESRGYYQTLAGFIITFLGKIPKATDQFEWGGLSFEILDMDGFRIDKVLVNPLNDLQEKQEV
ncbi:MAG: hemolysin family protein [Anaerolineales bacterium]|jgi:putative hemolysin|nr:hemolysin family protein [Anaerolineales bacterium]